MQSHEVIIWKGSIPSALLHKFKAEGGSDEQQQHVGPRFTSRPQLRPRTRREIPQRAYQNGFPAKADGLQTSNFLSRVLPDLHRHSVSSQKGAGPYSGNGSALFGSPVSNLGIVEVRWLHCITRHAWTLFIGELARGGQALRAASRFDPSMSALPIIGNPDWDYCRPS